MSLLRTLASACAYLLTRPAVIHYRLAARLTNPDTALRNASEALARIPGTRGVWLRRAFYRSVLPHVGDRSHIGFMTLLSKADARIGTAVYLGRFCTLGRVTIENHAIIADAVQLLSGSHQHQPANPNQPFQQAPQTFQHITISTGAWIGANAVVMADVGPNAIVAAGAVVTKPVPANTTVAGVPAKPLQTQPRLAA
ncbi:acyltransferase [Mucisphaera sp.]|uniref:acyltransferase n=1 Tax=Mucisphaera sp. TaxID=2913024 RepID=UPI003D11ABA8